MAGKAVSPAGEARFPRLYRPTWAEIDLGALASNLRRLRRLLPRTRLMFVVKADAYGHGALACARAAEEARLADWLGVSSVEEGIALREVGIRLPILILGSLYPFESTMAAIRYDLTPTVASLDGARLIAQAAEAAPQALGAALPRDSAWSAAPQAFGAALPRDSARSASPSTGPGEGRAAGLACHLKIDTGMGRIGVRWPAGLEVAECLRRARGVRLEGVYTHLARAESDPAYTRSQLRLFKKAVGDIERAGTRLELRHAAGSAAALRYPESRWDMVRPGLASYGLYGKGFEPVLSLKTRIVFLKNVGPGTPIGYGGLHRTRGPARIATLPIGYGDGLPRLMSIRGARTARRGAGPAALGGPKGSSNVAPRTAGRGTGPAVLIRGRRCPMVGTMSMDMTTVDVTGLEGVHVGDEAVLIGRSGREEIRAGELAEAARTIPYEIVTSLRPRVPRIALHG